MIKRVAILTALLFTVACVRAQIVVSTGSEAVALHYNGNWSAGNHTTESLDVYDWGATKANSLSAEVHEFLFPGPGVNSYDAAVKIQPTMAWLKPTNIKPEQFQLFAQAGGGETTLPGLTKGTFFGGGGAMYRATANLTWSIVDGYALRFNNQTTYAVSAGLMYTFNPAASQNAGVKAMLHKAATKVWGQ
jgi:hypothetical protein